MKHNYLKHMFTVLLLLCTTVASAHNFEVDGICFNILSEEDKTVEVTYKGNSFYEYEGWYKGNLVIPESVSYNGNTYSVTGIGECAFWCCTKLTGVTIPNSTTSIGNQAFTYCIGLKYIIIGKNVTSIGFWVFDDCSDYVVINFSQLTFTKGSSDYGEIAKRAFKVINNAENIDDFIFSSIDHTLEVYIGDDTELVLPNNYNGKNYSIGAKAFSGKANLTSIEIPGSVTSIGDSAFFGCLSLESVTIGNGVTSIGEYAFLNCTALAKVEIPNSVTRIGLWAFYNCDNLTEVEIPNGVTVLESGVFACCDNLANVIIPNSVTSIGVLSTGMEGPFEGCASLREIKIPNSVTTIGHCAFNWCTALENIEIPSSVTSIGSVAFGYCTALESVTSLVPAEELFAVDAFDGLDFDACTLYVPYGAKAKYASTNDWKNFKNIVELRPEEITISINEYGSATYCSDFALDFSNVKGLKAYAATGYNSKTGVITLTRLQTACEGTGLFLKGEPGEYVVPVLEATDDHSLNMLVGTLEKTTVNSTSNDGLYANYKYTINEGMLTPMFYQFADDSSLSANKAYLQIPLAWLQASASKSVEIRFDDGETTDIDEVEGENGDVENVYDLQGRVVENPAKGIYIVNGKKVFINK